MTAEARKWWTVAAMAFPLLLLTIDFFGITVALPSIGAKLGADASVLEWTVNAYALGFAAPLTAVGRLGDIIGRRRVLLLARSCSRWPRPAAASPRRLGLVAGRAVQGIGSAMIYSTSLSIVSNAFSPEERGAGIGVWTAIGLIGSAIGPLVGGVLTEQLSCAGSSSSTSRWRSSASCWRCWWWRNRATTAPGAASTCRLRPGHRRPGVPGAGLPAVQRVHLRLAAGDRQPGGGHPAAARLRLVERRSPEPLLQFELFDSRDYLGASGVAFLANYGFGVCTFFVTLYLQNILDYTPDQTGLVFLALSIPFMAMSLIVGRIQTRWGTRRPMAAGMGLIALSFAVLMFVSPTAGAGFVVAGLIITSIGQGLAYNISTTAGMSAIAEQKAGAASACCAPSACSGWCSAWRRPARCSRSWRPAGCATCWTRPAPP